MNHARNKSIIRARLANGASMAGIPLNQPGDEGAEGLLDTMIAMTKAGELVSANGLYSLPENDSVSWDGGDPVPAEKIAEICRGRPNMLVSIGYTGLKTCYLNTPVEDAIELYKAADDIETLAGISCEVVSFHSSFHAYEIGQ